MWGQKWQHDNMLWWCIQICCLATVRWWKETHFLRSKARKDRIGLYNNGKHRRWSRSRKNVSYITRDQENLRKVPTKWPHSSLYLRTMQLSLHEATSCRQMTEDSLALKFTLVTWQPTTTLMTPSRANSLSAASHACLSPPSHSGEQTNLHGINTTHIHSAALLPVSSPGQTHGRLDCSSVDDMRSCTARRTKLDLCWEFFACPPPKSRLVGVCASSFARASTTTADLTVT